MHPMKLQAYLDANQLSHGEFGALVGASEFGVRKWARGERTPRQDAMSKIQNVTLGAVSAADFFGPIDPLPTEEAPASSNDRENAA